MKIYLYALMGALLVIFLLFFENIINYFQLQAIAAGIILNLINSILAYIFFKKSLKKGNKQFLILVFGGMVFRLLSILFIFLIILISLKIDLYAFIFTFLIIYFISLIWEVSIYLKGTKKIRSI
jgi:hypothetical protein